MADLRGGRYEGIDQRVLDHAATRMPVEEISIGELVLSGGEAAALVIVEAVVQLLPGLMGNPASLSEESTAPAATVACWSTRSTPSRLRGAGWRCRTY